MDEDTISLEKEILIAFATEITAKHQIYSCKHNINLSESSYFLVLMSQLEYLKNDIFFAKTMEELYMIEAQLWFSDAVIDKAMDAPK